MPEYQLRMIPYCGSMQHTLVTGDLAKVRRRAASRLRWLRKNDWPVNVLERGREWEIETPDTAVMVSDYEGYLKITEIEGLTNDEEPEEALV